uniref:VWA domain-containing protein n=1 Tax=Haliangium sp. TaxID=2663208 RepID=UPI003D0CC406
MSELWRSLTELAGSVEWRESWYLVLAILAVPAFWLSRRSTGRVVFSSLSLLPQRASTWRTELAWLPDAGVAVAVVALSVALAGPRVARGDSHIQREGIAIMMVVDISSSMRALDLSDEDVEKTRLDAVKEVFRSFVEGDGEDLGGRPDDAIGLVSFAGYADTRCPLTLNHASLLSIAADLEIVSERSEDGTAIGDGLGLAVERLRTAESSSRVAILLTDGVDNAGVASPMEAAELARALGIKVYTIGAGTNGLAPAWSHVVDLETDVSVANAAMGNLAYLTNAKVRGKLKQTEKASGTAQFVWENSPTPGEGLLNGYRA